MRISSILIFSAIFMIIISASCSRPQVKDEPSAVSPQEGNAEIEEPAGASEVPEREYNFRFSGVDINIDDPEMDRRSYYKIYIDKVEAGRTTIGLESQIKIFELKMPANRHLLTVEKWVLDEKKGQYVKLNNIEQPKPSFVYFDLPENKTAEITLENDPVNNSAEFEVELVN